MKKNVIVLLSSLALAILSGCGQAADMPSQPEAEGEVTLWKTEGFAAPGKLEEEQAFWAGQYQPWDHGDQTAIAGEKELFQLDFGVCEELFWHFGTELGADGIRIPGPEGEYTLEIYDTASGKDTAKRFSPGELGLEGERGYLVDMDMIDREHYVFRWVDYEQDEEGRYHQTVDRMVYTDFAGDIRTVDFREQYLEKGIDQDELTEVPTLQSINWRCDGKGNICVIKKENGIFGCYLFGRNGEILLEYESVSEQPLVEPMRTPDGELILPVYDDMEKCYEFLWADTEEGAFRPLVQVEASNPYILQIYGLLGDDIYYRSQEGTEDGIVRWNIKSGRKVQVFGFQTAGIGRGYQTLLALREGQTPVLHLTKFKEGRSRQWLTALEEQRPMDDGIVRVADLTGIGERVAECAVLASMETLNFHYEYEEVSAQEARDRIMIELSQGEGPDLLFVSLEDLYMLEEKGLLLDMGELVSRELWEELLPGALEIGSVDGKLMGVPAAVWAETLVVAGNTWPKDTWRLEDVISLMEEGKLSGTLRSPYVMMSDYLTPLLTVQRLVNYSLEDSFLIDWENRKCHFDDDRFIRLLELTSTDMSGVLAETEDWSNGGKNIIWGYFTDKASFLDFFEHLEEEDGRVIGFPTEGSCGSYLQAFGGVLVVNVNIAHKEAATCFLETLIGEELQAKSNLLGLSIRRLSPESDVVREESGRLVLYGGINAPEVPIFQDGTTPLHRAKVFLENCVAVPSTNGQILQIIDEELNAMYAQNKSPAATAEIINSRVQLYLDERG